MIQPSSFILSGPEDNFDIPRESYGKYLFNCLKKADYHKPIIIGQLDRQIKTRSTTLCKELPKIRFINRPPRMLGNLELTILFDLSEALDAEIINMVDALTGETYTCGKLLEDSVKFSVVLKNLGIERGDAISIISENTLNYFVPVLSGLYNGVIVSPLNPTYLTGELKHGFNISKPKLVICSERTLKNVLAVKQELEFIETVLILGSRSENYPAVNNLEEMLEGIEVDVEQFVPEKVNYKEDGACILLTSGTTGLPKGAFITHENLRSSGYLKRPEYTNMIPDDTILLVLPYFHIFGLLVQLIALTAYSKVVLLGKFKPDIFLRSIQDYKVTKLFMVPPLVLFLAKSPLVDNYDLSSLREILSGAAPLGKDIQEETIQRFKTVTIRQAYGLTEVGGPATCYISNDKPGCVGSLIAGIQAKVCNIETGKAIGPMEVGELCIRGPMVMKCYAGNPETTKESFDEDGFFYTGDLGYYDQDENFYIVDRIKELIKYKGLQVAPAELEALIITHPGVKDCGVIGIPDERAGQLPFAFVAPQSGFKITEQEIIDYVAKRISAQKHLYGGVRFVEEIPKNQSGKILRRQLIEMYKTQ